MRKLLISACIMAITSCASPKTYTEEQIQINDIYYEQFSSWWKKPKIDDKGRLEYYETFFMGGKPSKRDIWFGGSGGRYKSTKVYIKN